MAITSMVRYLGRDRRAEYLREPQATPPLPPGAEEILADRFARREIDSDDYREGLDPLRHGTGPGEKAPLGSIH